MSFKHIGKWMLIAGFLSFVSFLLIQGSVFVYTGQGIVPTEILQDVALLYALWTVAGAAIDMVLGDS